MNIAITTVLLAGTGAIWLTGSRPEWAATVAGYLRANWPPILAAAAAALMYAGSMSRRQPRGRIVALNYKPYKTARRIEVLHLL